MGLHTVTAFTHNRMIVMELLPRNDVRTSDRSMSVKERRKVASIDSDQRKDPHSVVFSTHVSKDLIKRVNSAHIKANY